MTADLPTPAHLPTPPFDAERIAELPERRPGSLEAGKTDWDRRRNMLESDDDEPTPDLLY